MIQKSPRANLNLRIGVGPAAGGSGTISLTPFKTQPHIVDAVAPYEYEYVLYSEQALTGLKIKYVAAGTMPAESTVVLTSTGFPMFTRSPTDTTQVAVSGNVTLGPTGIRGRELTATVKAGGIQKGAAIVFSIKHFVGPKLADTSPGNASEGVYTIQIQSSVAALDLVVVVGDEPLTFGAEEAARVADGNESTGVDSDDDVFTVPFQFYGASR